MAGGSLADLNYWRLCTPEWAALVVHRLLDSLIHGDCSDALPLKHPNAECDEDQSQQSSNGKGFLQEHESNEQDDAHLCCRDQGR